MKGLEMHEPCFVWRVLAGADFYLVMINRAKLLFEEEVDCELATKVVVMAAVKEEDQVVEQGVQKD